jgi:hypothetical protein
LIQGNMYEGALHLSQEYIHDQPRIPFPLIAIRRGCYSEMESGGVVGLVKEDIRAAYVAPEARTAPTTYTPVRRLDTTICSPKARSC